MAVCERGYLCAACGAEVEEITDSALYLRFVLGEIEAERLHQAAEMHLRCDPVLTQFIVAEGFAPIEMDGPFAKRGLDPVFVAAEEARITRGYLRLRELAESPRPITDYPLPEARARRPG